MNGDDAKDLNAPSGFVPILLSAGDASGVNQDFLRFPIECSPLLYFIDNSRWIQSMKHNRSVNQKS